jgi:1,4-alpha-glucan branching enzyme
MTETTRRSAGPDRDASMVTVEFCLPDHVGAETVSVVGDFNGWEPALGVMRRDEVTGEFSCTVDVQLGCSYQYRFLLDGERWVNDWKADRYAPNAFGGDDSVLDLTDAIR